MSDGDGSRESGNRGSEDERESVDREELRERVEREYDFADFGPREMEEMSAEEWEAVFDSDSWVTGRELLDRVEDDLLSRIASRDVFAVLERESAGDGGEERLVAYSDEGYAVVYEDGSVEGSGTVLRDVKPSVALASMPDYEVPDPPPDASLPDPEDVPEGSGALGNLVLQSVAVIQVAAGVVLLLGSVLYDPLLGSLCTRVPGTFADPAVPPAYSCAGVTLNPLGGSAVVAGLAGVGFVAFGVFLLVVVANARLSDRFRAEEFRDRLRKVQEAGERPDFVPDSGDREDRERDP